ncbi:DNA end protector [Serratia phage phiMAM1]|uniref:DNA end protector protein n=2 Tax=Miltonvirus MAM1 TaxID=2169689 RepID=K7YB85_9CAUD|nr:DNA end protector [Serratia phage phiMAM1]AFX93612.1 DNA end protector protein [Serratia phage phiMAM1]ASZ78922.1 DNA end protector protein [Serratia phage 2050H1]
MAKNLAGEEDPLLLDNEVNAPELVKRYIIKYRQNFGAEAKRNIHRSHVWFTDRISKDANLTPNHMMQAFKDHKRPANKDRYLIGRMFYFKYDAKTKDELPYWDMYPLVFFFNARMGDGIEFGDRGVTYLWGLNLHYLPPKLRLLVFEDIIRLRNERAYRAKTRLRLTWKAISRFANHPLYQHCVKLYRADHMRTQLFEIEPQWWEIVIPMRTARFQKQSQASVWKDARRKKK